MLSPKRTKYRKQQKVRIKGNAGRGYTVDFGSFGLKRYQTYRRKQKLKKKQDEQRLLTIDFFLNCVRLI